MNEGPFNFFNLAATKTVLVFGAHGDDEILGCGGTIWTLSQMGCKVIAVTFTDRESASVSGISLAEGRDNAIREMSAADKVLGVHKRIPLSIDNRTVKHDGETLVRCAKLIRQYRPDTIFVHRGDDQHTDHRAVWGAVTEGVWKAWENINNNSPDHPDPDKRGWGPNYATPVVLEYEIMLRRIATPHLIVTLTEAALKKKIEAMATQFSQLEALRNVLGHIEHRARDLGSLMNAYAGEAFAISNFHPVQVHLEHKPA